MKKHLIIIAGLWLGIATLSAKGLTINFSAPEIETPQAVSLMLLAEAKSDSFTLSESRFTYFADASVQTEKAAEPERLFFEPTADDFTNHSKKIKAQEARFKKAKADRNWSEYRRLALRQYVVAYGWLNEAHDLFKSMKGEKLTYENLRTLDLLLTEAEDAAKKADKLGQKEKAADVLKKADSIGKWAVSQREKLESR